MEVHWLNWLLERRHGGSIDYQRLLTDDLERICGRVLDGARLAPSMTLVDVGTGDGLIAFGAIARMGASLRVVLTDACAPLLRHAERLAIERGVREQCVFLEGAAEKLNVLPDVTADVVTARAVLAYVAAKSDALREFYRVLKPGGRISLAEPIFRDAALEVCALTKIIEDQGELPDLEFLRLLHRLKAAQLPSTEGEIQANSVTNYAERDLMRIVREAGFVDVHMELHIDHRPSLITAWEVFLDVAPYPWAPTPREVLAERFSEVERRRFELIMRPVIESGKSLANDCMVYLTAEKPAVPDVAPLH